MGQKKVPVDAFALWSMIRDVLDPRHEAVRQPMGEATAVDGGSLPSVQIMFSAIDEEKEGDCALPPEEGRTCRTLQPGALGKPLKIYPSVSDLRQSPPPPFVPPRAQEFPTLPQSLPEHCLRLRKIKSFLKQRSF